MDVATATQAAPGDGLALLLWGGFGTAQGGLLLVRPQEEVQLRGLRWRGSSRPPSRWPPTAGMSQGLHPLGFQGLHPMINEKSQE